MSQVRSATSVRPADPPTLLDAEPGKFCFGFHRNISLVYWHGQADGPALQRLRGLTDHMLRNHPDGYSNATFVRRNVPMPTPEAREGFKHVFDGRVSALRCMGLIVEGEGFWASGLRSTVTTLALQPERRLQLHLDTTIEGTAEWLAPIHSRMTGSHLTAAELRSALRDAREQMLRAVESPALE